MGTQAQEDPAAERIGAAFWFPGRWIGGLSLVIGPLLFLAAALLRSRFHFFFDAQLAAYADHPALSPPPTAASCSAACSCGPASSR